MFNDINNHLAKKLEGGLFENITMTFCGRDYVIRRDFYTVKNGKVYNCSGGKLTPTEDSFMNVYTECQRIGTYNPNKEYHFKTCAVGGTKLRIMFKLNGFRKNKKTQ